ncbi:hypothetical protein GOZ97_16520 [Agrobacterium vitis]|uniref:hypothetical protein n=1 Tax=Rhizobium/Agrobacterium group TaxID=227290 RepID=UPI0008DC14EF|nr:MULTISPECIES: hypothetical protein [Rhizobium/Agrobacterium group]MCF1433194.1 hypothetical protein [Allorhizobium ampelinum]MUO91739.1 hypothetical protein [Agrobacterium vitis]MUZ54760.1 hypothetical protein [Agrobacterium vitis]MUZ93032.1 hypothetical protein [Agrobacterium vitis]MVA41446.1 hypothetical protein [Agrobacterium vitis]
MTLEQFTAQLNATTFWKEFTFSQTRFVPRPKVEVELADGIVKIGSLGFVFQLKERTEATEDPEIERRWFKQKVLRKAKDQIKASLRYLSENEKIHLTNDQGHEVEVMGRDLRDIKKVIVYFPGRLLPEDCWATQYVISGEAGFIHVIAANDYLGVLDKLLLPDDVRLYFEYREAALLRLKQAGTVVTEPDIMVGFLADKDLPQPGSIESLRDFVQDLESFDLSYLMYNLRDHIVHSGQGNDYYRIMEEFARVPRSVWREFKKRLMICLDAARMGEFRRPLRLAFPRTDCAFMIAAMDPKWPVRGPEGIEMRSKALAMYTQAAKYDLKTGVGVGLLISKDGASVSLDWCHVDAPWKPDSKMEELIRETQMFGPVRDMKVDSFLFRGGPA